MGFKFDNLVYYSVAIAAIPPPNDSPEIKNGSESFLQSIVLHSFIPRIMSISSYKLNTNSSLLSNYENKLLM